MKIDRHNQYRVVQGFFFPHHENPRMPLRSTILDGELVIDVDPRTKKVFKQSAVPPTHSYYGYEYYRKLSVCLRLTAWWSTIKMLCQELWTSDMEYVYERTHA